MRNPLPIVRMLSKGPGNPATKKEHKCRGFVVNLGVNDRRRRANAFSSRLLVGEWMIEASMIEDNPLANPGRLFPDHRTSLRRKMQETISFEVESYS